MAKASLLRPSFNAGEFSPFMEGRTDLDRYPASMRRMMNTVALPQGPAIKRSGTTWQSAVYNENFNSSLIPFVFSELQSNTLEFSNFKMRVHSEAGVQTYTPESVAGVSQAVPFTVLNTPGIGFVAGDQVFLSGFPKTSNANNRTAIITNVSTGVLTLDFEYIDPEGTIPNITPNAYVAKVFIIASPYAHTDVSKIRYLQSVDVVYLFCDGYRNYKLSRKSAYDWTIVKIDYNDGPYMPVDNTGTALSVSVTGNPIGPMTSNTGPYGVITTLPYVSDVVGKEPWRAFDAIDDTYWDSNRDQEAYLTFTFPGVGIAVDGYVIYPAKDNSSADYASVDYAPGSFTFSGSNDGVNWALLNAEKGYVLYDNHRSVWFKLNNKTVYKYYRFIVTECRRNGPIHVRIARLVFSSPSAPALTITASKTDNINNGDGFKPTDVGRLIRIKDLQDAVWRTLSITTWVNSTTVVTKLLSEPFVEGGQKLQWRLGYFSDTTGWPVCGEWFEDRLALAGPSGFPDLITLSRTGAYEDMQTSTPNDMVLDDSAVVFRINSRKLSRIRWIANDERGLLVGTGSQEFVVVPADANTAFSARNIRARKSTERGAADMEPARVDRQVLYTQASGKTVREYAYVYATDGYQAPSMSLFSSHLGASKFKQMVYAAEPNSLVWFRRENGSVVALTYNREENVVGWHQHDFAGGIVESICSVPSTTTFDDALWMVVRRTVNSVTRRYIERLNRLWDFDNVLADAHFVDCGIRYQGASTDMVYGLYHLEGRKVNILVDGIPCMQLTVAGGRVQLPFAGMNIVAGLSYEMFGEISRIEGGAADGTSQGKTKRIHNVSAILWQSAYGEIGIFNEKTGEYEFEDVEYPESYDQMVPLALQSAMVGPIPMPSGYGKRGSISFRSDTPLPFNIVSLMPQLNTFDR